MSQLKTLKSRFMVSIYDDPEVSDALRFTFVPKAIGLLAPGEAPPQYIVSIPCNAETANLTWIQPPQKASLKAELEGIGQARVAERVAWMRRVSDLVKSVETWAQALGWSTKRIEKKIEDWRLGNHKVAGLVMQDDAVRVLLEPISATAPGAEGLVDLCLMPGYDDIASLYHDQTGWQVHYVFPTLPGNAKIQEGETRPLSKKMLGVVLEEMKKNAS